VHKTVDLLLGLILESSSLDAVHDLLANPLGITDLLEEAAVLSHTRNTESSVLSAYTNNKHVVRNLGLGSCALDLRIVENLDNLALRVNAGSFGLIELSSGLLVTEDSADRLHDGAVLDGTGSAGGQERSEQEVVARRDYDDIVVFGIELLEESNGAPASAWSSIVSCRETAIVVRRVIAHRG
jgi:hypothetical protein